MTDPGLPPRPRSLNLLESLVKEEEEKALQRGQGQASVVIPTEGRESVSPEFYDVDKQQITRENSASRSFTEFKMKETENKASKVPRGNPNAGFKGKKLKKQRSRSNSSERIMSVDKKSTRPFSADYSQNKRNKLTTSNVSNGRPKTSKGRRSNKRTSSPKGQRSRSPHSYSSDTYSSDEEYIKKEKYRSNSNSPIERKEKSDNDSFFDSDKDNYNDRQGRRNSRSRSNSSRSSSSRSSSNSRSRSRSRSRSHSRSRSRSQSRSRSRSRSNSSHSSSSDDEKNKKTSHVKMNGGPSQKMKKSVSNKGKKSAKSHSDSSDHQRMVIDDYSPTISSEDESKKSDNRKEAKTLKSMRKAKPLLSRKKRKVFKLFQIDPDLYLEGKLHQKYSELEELMNCSFVDQRSHVTRHHIYQMELLRNQYREASHGLPTTKLIIPQSLPGDIRNRSARPASAKNASRRAGSDQGSVTYDNAYGTLRSVMAAEHARQTGHIRTDILADRPNSAKRPSKKKKKIDAHLKGKKSDTEEETSERPSFSSKTSDRPSNYSKTDSRGSSSPRTPRIGPSIDDHIKYTHNEKLKKWLKEKDKIYRQQVKEERRKKREEREKLVNEANEKFENRIKSQKIVKQWMKEKNKEWVQMKKEKRQKEKEEDEWLENYKKKKSIPGDALQIRPQSAPSRRPEDVKIDKENIKGDDTPEYVKDQIHKKREVEEESKQSQIAKEGPHPPQTKFIYKRPVAGKIKLKMQVRGKCPVAQKSDTEATDDKTESEQDKSKQMRLSYDEWVKKKRVDDAAKKKNAARQRELAKSDPELERLIPELGKRRIENKLNMRKRIDTGIKKFDEQMNKEFGGADFNGEPIEHNERPRSAYRLESDRKDSGSPALSVKQIQRPSTAPSSRGKVPSPKKSENSPRKAIIPQKVDKVMANEDTSNPYALPFPPEKGIPPHVAERQRKLFADQITSNLNEIEQRALLRAELIKEGVSEADIEEVSQRGLEEFDPYRKKMVEREREQEKDARCPKIEEIMYSPRKRDEPSDSSNDDSPQEEINEELPDDSQNAADNSMKDKDKMDLHSETSYKNRHEHVESAAGENGHSHYKTYDNLNELNLDLQKKPEKHDDHLKEDIEELKRKVESLKSHSEPQTKKTLLHNSDENKTESSQEEMVNITIISENDPNVVSILKDTKKTESFPVPEASEEPSQSNISSNGDQENGAEPGSQDDLANSRKRVSFNEQTEVFQSFETSSTDTLTPEPEDFDPNAESLDNQDFEIENNYNYDDDDFDDDRPDIMKIQGEKLTINIGGLELNPTVIKREDLEEITGDNDDEKKAIFITNPESDESGTSDE